MNVISCLMSEHDLWLVGLAALTCLAGSWVSLRLFARVRTARGSSRAGWLFLCAVAAGASIWTTHFIGMLAYQPGVPASFEAVATIHSLLIAIGGCFLGFAIASSRRLPGALESGGAVVGATIAAMHYIGVTAYQIPVPLTWNRSYVLTSIVIAIALAALALNRAGRSRTARSRYGAAAALVFAIVGLHFTGMAAVSIAPPAEASVGLGDNDVTAMALAIGGVGLLVIATGFASYGIDANNRFDTYQRLRSVANAAIEGLVVEENGRIIEVNEPFERMAGLSRDIIVKSHGLSDFLPRFTATGDDDMSETQLRSSDGSMIDVEVLTRNDLLESGKRVFAIRDIRQRLAHESHIRHLAQNDALTGLPNRVTFASHLDRELFRLQNGGGRLAVLTLDLNNFKDVNDLRGHRAGDEVLQILASRMMGGLGSDEFVGRIGGDEFSAIKPFQSREELTEFIERLKGRLAEPIPFPDGDVITGVSIGVAIFPEDGGTREALVNNADLAMHRAKMSPTDGCVFYEESMEEAMRERRQLAGDLRHAIEAGQFELRYQVQTAISTGEITGYEVLLRWKHPERGYVAPLDFIPIAEETGMILPIGEWVLRTACATAATWDRPYRIAVNLSPIQLTHSDLPRIVHQILLDTGLSGSRLELEVTESVMMSDPERARAVLRQIKILGVTIAMDDFGTGFSSLSTLRAFPFDKIKLDRSFMSEVENNSQAKAIIRAVLALGRGLDIPVLAEGVETREQLSFLDNEGCDEAQGYLLGRPVPLDDLNLGEERSAVA